MASDPRHLDRADVCRGHERAGAILRTPSGTVFEYDEEFVSRHSGREPGIATGLPYAHRRFETGGGSVHAFFANLLPEGLRLTALAARLKSSLDDHFSLLLAVGADPVGDVCVVPEGAAPWLSRSQLDVKRPHESDFRALFRASVAGGGPDWSVPGVQDKISGSMVSLPLHAAQGRAEYILKLNAEGKPTLVTNESFFLTMARSCGLTVPAHRVVRDRNGEAGLLVTRFDRLYSPESVAPDRLHVEDGCQLLGVWPAFKYNCSIRELVECVLSNVDAPAVEAVRLVRVFAFSYLIANGDLHAKNLSVIWDRGQGRILSPAYDLLSTLPYGDQTMALRLDGRDSNWKRRDFVALGRYGGLSPKVVDRTLDRLLAKARPWIDRIGEAGLDVKRTAHLQRVMGERAAALA